ncbi:MULTISPECIES: energy-coupling factor transporter transmembrane component T family protein [Clostridium]|nr:MULTISPECIES: energy-coupling factor transporter transmembrane component T [Clostridium]ALR90369.1 cobalt transporter [Clostridium butyricum]ALS18610.1 cobalt transporter [Clostridium butyricum]ANF15790.1 cobalt transporter [Clostridium butyricum]AOR95709.1 cobalt transporter [Clostridium butyricum]ENZ32305.1 hypothetical protein HMPREF1084_02719 [Clostridium butyricum 60E.3]
MKLVDNMTEFLTVENIKFEIMRIAYGNPNSILSKIDARVIIIWYLFFSLIPWFISDIHILLSLFVLTVAFSYYSRISLFVVILLALSFITENITVSIMTLFMGGSKDVFMAMFIVSLKLLIISLSTVCIFTSMDPEILSDALIKFGLPPKFGFGISYGYRMIPILIDEYNSIFNSFRLRGKRPENKKFFGANIIAYYLKILMKSFYPMILNTAKRVRSTVEALETKGFSESAENPKVKKLKLSYMRIKKNDYIFIIVSTTLVILTICIGNLF